MSTNSIFNPSDNWSQPVNRLSGRLRIEFEDLSPGLRFAVYLELKNHAFDAIAVINLPEIRAQLSDSSGQPVSTAGISGNGPPPLRQWAVIPRDAYVGLRVDIQAAAVPMKEQRLVFLGLASNRWRIGTGSYRLKPTAVFAPEPTGPTNQWTGELELPAVEIVVTDDMFN